MRPQSAEVNPYQAPVWGYLAADSAFVDNAFAPETFARVACAPGFPEFMRRYAARRLDMFAATSAPIRWLTRDLARSGLLYAALIRDMILGGVTVSHLCEAAKLDRTCSRGRVLAWVEGARKRRLITVPAGSGPWTQRRLELDPGLRQGAARRLQIECHGYAPLAQELTCFAALGQEALRSYLQTIAELSVMRPDIVRGAEMPISRLLHTDGGAELMFHLLARQRPNQTRLLEPIVLNMSACARQAGISRVQIHRLLKIADEAQLFRLTERRTVVFSPTMLHNYAWVLTVYMQVLRVAARVAKSRAGVAD